MIDITLKRCYNITWNILRKKEDMPMKTNQRFEIWKTAVLLLCALLLLSYLTAAFLPHSHHCGNADCTVCSLPHSRHCENADCAVCSVLRLVKKSLLYLTICATGTFFARSSCRLLGFFQAVFCDPVGTPVRSKVKLSN